ncbi:hypothetical protein [Fibrella forsythiae]|uniref:Uncharacterized protein n=1 Tax=Fibrella forsythiae TaxID=2817061 RepID=A0ABS3JBE6_9BACT|nr:hypothetical protein [Fibrella forsythiae]MBO0947314.1 hypothetical protein [Fibrella forsythiae]
MNYHLCSAAVIEHMQPSEVSHPFPSGYPDDTNQYYVARFDYEEAETYYNRVILPYNEKSRVGVDFWFRTCNPNHIDAAAVRRMSLKECRRVGLFRAIENALRLTNETNRALTIYSLAEQFNCSPVEFINKIAPIPQPEDQVKLQEKFLRLVAGQVDQLTRYGRFPIRAVNTHGMVGGSILDLGETMGRYTVSFNRINKAVLD